MPPTNTTKKKKVALKLNTPALRKWVAALTSGKYKKVKVQLKGGRNEFCALGVGCKVFEIETGEKLSRNDWQGDTLPERVRDWFGLKSSSPSICVEVEKQKGCNPIWSLNDDGLTWAGRNNLEVSFEAIAQGIAKTFKL